MELKNDVRGISFVVLAAAMLAFIVGVGCGGSSKNPPAADDAGMDAAEDGAAQDAAPDAEGPAHFATCKELREATLAETGEAPIDGTYTLFVGGDAAKPWDAFCRRMNLSEPLEYLSVDDDDNYSSISTGTVVATTSYRRYRINPTSLEIDPMDGTFAVNDDGFGDVVLPLESLTQIPAGYAEFQPASSNDGPAALSQASLVGTPFAFSESILENGLGDFFCKVSTNSVEGDDADSTVTVEGSLRGFELEAINANTASSPEMNASTRYVADCANLGPDSDFTMGAWPLVYAGP